MEIIFASPGAERLANPAKGALPPEIAPPQSEQLKLFD
jgi:hypothetical protein